MNAKVEKAGASNALDVVKLVLAGALLVAGLVAYYYFADWNGWARLGMSYGAPLRVTVRLVIYDKESSNKAIKYVKEQEVYMTISLMAVTVEPRSL